MKRTTIQTTFTFASLLLLSAGVNSFNLFDLLTLFNFSSGGCNGVEPQENFSLYNLTGSWYISYQINKQEDNKNLCAIYDIQIANSGNITYDMYTRVSPGIVMKTPAQAKIPNKDKPAILSVSYNFLPQFPETIVMTETDYDNYAVAVTCSPLGEPSYGYVLSRKEKIPQTFLNKGIDVLENIFTNQTGSLMKTDNCKLVPIGSDEKIITMGSSELEALLNLNFSQ